MVRLYYLYHCTVSAEKGGSSKKPMSQPKLWITDGSDPFTGMCLFFVRSNLQKAITNLNIHQECNFGILEANGGGLLGAIEELLSSIFIPALSNQKKWGDLTGPEGDQLKQNFLTKLKNFASVLANAKASVSEVVELSRCTELDLSSISPGQISTLVGSADFVEAAEKRVVIWCAEIEQVRDCV